jgi:chemotaxis protein methyltransferase CheR
MENLAVINAPALEAKEFDAIRQLLHNESGIELSDDKRTLVASRLHSRLRHFELGSFSDYLNRITQDGDLCEKQIMVDLLTTNETYFYREPGHFEFLRDEVCKPWNKTRPLRIWSAACSSGDEPYSIAMVCSDHMGYKPWELFATDLSERVLEQARAGHYPMTRARNLPREYLVRYCLNGVRAQAGTFKVHPQIRSKVIFKKLNLNSGINDSLGKFDIIFLRNVLIYFNKQTCAALIKNLSARLQQGGLLIVSHTESLHGIAGDLQLVKPSVYRRP